MLSFGGDFGSAFSDPLLIPGYLEMLLSLVTPIVFLILALGAPANAYFKAMTGR
ncbi:hypothetical protein [Saccharopolyspora sp. NPDC002686]|uniref:hypothetical protein n=1 Tax=Saccharopolyspora sp. NPDC002686 TaxID=3154541 RepID=UPI00331A6526